MKKNLDLVMWYGMVSTVPCGSSTCTAYHNVDRTEPNAKEYGMVRTLVPPLERQRNHFSVRWFFLESVDRRRPMDDFFDQSFPYCKLTRAYPE